MTLENWTHTFITALGQDLDRRAWRRTQRRWAWEDIAAIVGAIGSVAVLAAIVVMGIGEGVVW